LSDPFFDTNILIDWLSGKPQAIAELLASEPMETRRNLVQLLASFEMFELDERIAAAAADIRYRDKMKLLDAYILATAQVNGAILITRNTKDFPAEIPGIRVPYTI
jgi:predicted nucleic acid-binding protein